jgi:hypothetical protein
MAIEPVRPPDRQPGGASVIHGSPSQSRSKSWAGRSWKAYAWFLAAVATAALFVIPLSASLPLALVDAAATAVSVAGVFAFAYRRRLLTERFWRVWLPSLLAWDLIYNFGFIAPRVGAEFGALVGFAAGAGLILAGLPIVLPAYVALFRYGFAARELWARADGGDAAGSRDGSADAIEAS